MNSGANGFKPGDAPVLGDGEDIGGQPIRVGDRSGDRPEDDDEAKRSTDV